MKKNNCLLIFVIASITLFSCGKDGATGPAGAAGTANVIYSDWITPSAYTETTSYSINHYDVNIPSAGITQAILDNGTVLVYCRFPNGYTPQWPAGRVGVLPITVFYNSGIAETWSAAATVGNIEIDFVDNQNQTIPLPTAAQFRYVIIPGGVHTLSSIDIHSYQQVALALHLKN